MARSFNGTTDGAAGASVTPINFNYNSTFSVFGWFNFAGSAGSNPFDTEQALVGHLQTFNAWFTGWELHKESTASGNWINGFLINKVGTPAWIYKNSAFIPTGGTWCHVGFTYSGSTLASGMNLYANGAISNGTVVSDTLGNNATTNAILPYIGQRDNGTVRATCTMADIGVWNVELTAGEVAALAKGIRPPEIRRLSLVAYWPLDGLASPEPDLSSNVNNMTLTGTALASGPPMTMFTPRWRQLVLPTSAPAVTSVFRKTASRIGTRVGTRQTWAA